jgi:hypothetical protein
MSTMNMINHDNISTLSLLSSTVSIMSGRLFYGGKMGKTKYPKNGINIHTKTLKERIATGSRY